ncbi:MAG: acyl-CoA dehydrogenase family protein [Pseudomonadota bacterium]
MGTLSNEEVIAIQDAFTRLLQDKCTEQHVRAWMKERKGYDADLWQAIAEMGITGLLVEEKFGGVDAGVMAAERVMEQAGSALLGAPLLTSAIMSVTALQASGDADAQARLLPQLASGESIATLLMTSPQGDWTEHTIGISATKQGDTWQLTGSTGFVLHGRGADVWLAVANTDSGPTLFEVSPTATGASCSQLPSFDHTMVMDQVNLSNTSATQVGEVGAGWQAVQQAIDLGIIALAGEQAGGAQRILDITVEYAKIRHQFGRQIGSFQAVKHMAADLVLEVESAVSAARQAAAKADEHAEDAAEWRYLAGFACADAYTKTAADAVQMHGGIAFTWEHPAHLYLRRSRANAQLFGTSDFYREQYLNTLGG